MSLRERPAPDLPDGSELQHITFVVEGAGGQPVLMEFPDPIKRRAVLVVSGGTDPVPATDLLLLAVAAPDDEDAERVATVRDWVDSAVPDRNPKSLVITLQGAQIVWSQDRVAVVARPDRLDAVRKALIEVTYYEAELRAIERDLGERWPHLEADAPLAFEFDPRAIRKRPQLAQRFQQVVMLRARLARITPHVLCPHVHPPTLASQVGERVRERTRMAPRLELLGGQLEVFERVYDSCGQRASDFMLTRTSNTLEWVIIVLLLTQTVLVAIDLMASAGK